MVLAVQDDIDACAGLRELYCIYALRSVISIVVAQSRLLDEFR
jgi:hypothetical protein